MIQYKPEETLLFIYIVADNKENLKKMYNWDRVNPSYKLIAVSVGSTGHALSLVKCNDDTWMLIWNDGTAGSTKNIQNPMDIYGDDGFLTDEFDKSYRYQYLTRKKYKYLVGRSPTRIEYQFGFFIRKNVEDMSNEQLFFDRLKFKATPSAPPTSRPLIPIATIIQITKDIRDSEYNIGMKVGDEFDIIEYTGNEHQPYIVDMVQHHKRGGEAGVQIQHLDPDTYAFLTDSGGLASRDRLATA